MTIGSLQTTLGDLVESGEGFIQTGPFGSQLHAHDYVENGIPVVMPQQLGDNEISEYGISQINEQDRDRLIRHVMRVGDIVFRAYTKIAFLVINRSWQPTLSVPFALYKEAESHDHRNRLATV